MVGTNQSYSRPAPYPQNMFQQIFVQGIEGARAYQMPYGVNAAILWDSEQDLFYVKQIDAMGRPFIAKTCSYADYTPPEPVHADPVNVDTSSFVTKEYLDRVLSQLVLGEKGKVVRDESAQ